MKNENKYILYVGLNDKDTKKQELRTGDAQKIIQQILFNNQVEGFTIYKAKGLYKHTNGEITKETTIIIELLYISNNIINNIIKDLKKALNQESILKQVQKMAISFE